MITQLIDEQPSLAEEVLARLREQAEIKFGKAKLSLWAFNHGVQLDNVDEYSIKRIAGLLGVFDLNELVVEIIEGGG